MDGYGLAGPGTGNAVVNARTPVLDRLFALLRLLPFAAEEIPQNSHSQTLPLSSMILPGAGGCHPRA